ADVIVALDSDFLAIGPGCVRYARDFAGRRRAEDAARMNRLYAIESMPTSTGSRADHRLALRPSRIGAPAAYLAAALGPGEGAEAERKFVDAVAKDLLAHRGRSLVVAGDSQPAEVHALAHAMNRTLGNVGSTVVYTPTVEAEPVDQTASLRDLVADMSAGKVDLLVVVSANPVYSAPADVKFADPMNKVHL